MSSIKGIDFAKEVLENSALQQYGIKGMKWGVRRSRSSESSKPNNPKATKVPNTFGNKPKNRRMSDAELRNKLNRLQMEKQYAELTRPSPKAKSFARQLLEESGKQMARNVANRAATAAVNMALDGAAKRATGSNKEFLEQMINAVGKKKK